MDTFTKLFNLPCFQLIRSQVLAIKIILLVIFFSASQLQAQTLNIHANLLTDNSSDFENHYKLINGDLLDFSKISVSTGLLSESFLDFEFPEQGSAGDIVTVLVKSEGNVLDASILEFITIDLYNSSGILVGSATDDLLEIELVSETEAIFAIRFPTNHNDDYQFTVAEITLLDFLNNTSLDLFEIAAPYFENPCPALSAAGLNSYSSSTGIVLKGKTFNPDNAVDENPTTFATLSVPLSLINLSPAYITVDLESVSKQGDYVGFVVSESASLLSLSLLENIKITAYNSSGEILDEKSDFTLADLKLLSGVNNTYSLGFITDEGDEEIASLRLQLSGVLNLLSEINVHQPRYFDPNPDPIEIIEVGSRYKCTGQTLSLTTNVTEDTHTFKWSTGAETKSIEVMESGEYYVTVTNTATTCEVSSATLVIEFEEEPEPSFSEINAVSCYHGNDGEISVDFDSTDGLSFEWNTGETSLEIDSLIAGDYILTVYDSSNGCLNDFVFEVDQPDELELAFDIKNEDCETGNGYINLNPEGGTEPYIYKGSYDFEGHNRIVGLKADVYEVIVVDSNGCSDTISANVEGTQLPSLSAGNDTSICEGETVVLKANNPDVADVFWNNGVIDGAGFIPSASNQYIVTANLSGCVTKDTINVIVNPKPDFTVYANNPTSCGGTDGKIIIKGLVNDEIYGVGYNNQPLTYKTAQGDSISVAGLSSSIPYNNIIIETEKGCRDTYLNITLRDPDAPSINTLSDTTICAGSSVELLANTDDGIELEWDNNVENGDFVIPDATTIYTVTASFNGCVAKESTVIMVNSLPVIFTKPDTTICEGESIELNASGANSYVWSNGVQNGELVTPSKTTTYNVVGTDLKGCSSHQEVTITVNPKPVISVDQPELSICEGKQFVLEASGADTYVWDNGLDNGSVLEASTSRVYAVTGTDINGCSNSLTVNVVVKENCEENKGDNNVVELNIHDVITPNSDGFNDVWIIEGIEMYPDNLIKLYNKWGDIVYESKNYQNNWNGYHQKNSTLLPAGTYYYLLKLNANNQKDCSGYLMIQY